MTDSKTNQKQDVKKFLIRSVIFLAALIVLVLAVNILYNVVVLKNLKLYRAEQSYEDFLATSPDRTIDYAFFGASPTLNAANPRYINNSFVLGAAGEYYLHMYYRTRRTLTQDHVKIKTAFIEVAPQSLSTALVDDQRVLANTWYYQHMMTFDEMHQMTGSPAVELIANAMFPFIGRGSYGIDFLSTGGHTQMYRGWENLTDVDSPNTADRAKSAGYLYYRDFTDGGINNDSMAYFVKTLALLHEYNVSVVLIRYPSEKEYNDMVAQHGVVDRYYAHVFAAAENVTPYTYMDYHDLLDNHPDYFADSFHLNDRGAEFFMTQLRNDLNASAPTTFDAEK